jgi:dCTP diphosphatase
MNEIEDMTEALRKFSEERNWTQFHSPKNLASALSVEAAELLEHFQWLTEEQSTKLSRKELDAVAEEIADVQIYLLQLADKLAIDIQKSVGQKMEKNASKYPIDAAFGNARKHRQHGDPSP